MRRRDQVSWVATIGGLLVAVLAIGGAHRWSQAIVSFLLAVALVPLLRSRRTLGHVSPLIAMLATAWVLTAVQLIPLPDAVLHVLQPTGSALREDGAELVGAHPWNSLSLDPPATLRALTFFTSLLAFAVLSLRAAASESARYWIQALIAGTCGLVAVIVGFHSLFGIDSLYGVYSPAEARPPVLGPLLNANHLGCLMALGANVAVGLALYRRQSSRVRVTWFVVAAACAATAVASESRGATLALMIGALLTLGVRIAQRFIRDSGSKRAEFLTTSLPIAIVAGCAIVVVVYMSAGSVTQELSHTDLAEVGRPKSKFLAWKSAAKLIEESPWTGVGRGALEPTFTRVHPASSLATYAYVENEYVQAVVDWGIPGAALLAACGLWLASAAIRRWRNGPLAAGALGGLAAIAFQSNVDYGLELLGVAVPLTIMLSTVAYVPVSKKERPIARRIVAIRCIHVVGLVIGGILLLTSTTTTLAEDHVALRHAKERSSITEVIQRHPLDYFGYAVAAQSALGNRDSTAIRLLNHALALHPTHSGLHLMTARLLISIKRPEQAAIEYASAVRGVIDPRPVVREIVAVLPPNIAATALPADYWRIEELVNALTDLGRQDIATVWLDGMLRRGPSVRTCQLLFNVSLQSGNIDAAKTAIARCTTRDLSQQDRTRLAKLMISAHELPDAIRLLEKVDTWEGRVDEKFAAWLLLCDAHEATANLVEARDCLRRLDRSGLVTPANTNEVIKRLDRLDVGPAQR
jgi:O-antigen ligase